MRTTVNLDEELVGEAQQLTAITERSALLRAALIALIERQLEYVPRRRSRPA